jgi:hypothetical protein
MSLIKKNFRNKVRELSLPSHLSYRSTHASAPKRGVTRQPQIVEVHCYG